MEVFNFLRLLRPAPHIKKLPEQEIDAAYKKYRRRNFLGIFLAYICYYLLRGNLSLASPELIKLGFTKTKLGFIMSFLSCAYGISKFVMGNVSDRSNPRWFLVFGLGLVIISNLMFGAIPDITNGITIMCVLMAINGWAQGMGAPPCYRTVAHWFPISRRGTVMGVWNVSHNVGACLLALLVACILSVFSWRGVFFIPAILVSIATVGIAMLMRDTPQSVGLMSIEEYSNEYPKDHIDGDAEKELSAKEILFKYVLVNKYVWLLGFANACVYLIRYGVSSWAPTYLTQVLQFSKYRASMSLSAFEASGILGMLLCGYASDNWFKGKRAPVSILCMIMVLFGLFIYWRSSTVVSIYIALSVIGMFIYGPVMLVGVQMIDIMPKKAVGTAVGLLGLFGYFIGQMSGNAVLGYVSDISWNGIFFILIAACIIATIFFSLTLSIGNKKSNKVSAC